MTAKELYYYLNELNVDGKLKGQTILIVNKEVGLLTKVFSLKTLDWDSNYVVLNVSTSIIGENLPTDAG